MLCGVARTARILWPHPPNRLNRGGDRQANSALHRIMLSRLRWDPHTHHYMRRRTKEGLSKPEVMRCLKRYIAHEIYKIICTSTPTDVTPSAT
jgi:hypothetical protein